MNVTSKEYIDNLTMYLDILDITEIMVFILSMLVRGFIMLSTFITLDYFTPMHIVLVLILGEVSFIFIEEYNWKLYLKIIFFIFLIFFVLIFVEIIELNLFGLQKNTRKNISERSSSEEIDTDILRNDYIVNDMDSVDSQTKSNESDGGKQKVFLLNENYYINI